MFYFPSEDTCVFQNAWDSYAPKTPQNVAKTVANNNIFINDYPSPQVLVFSEFAQYLKTYFANDLSTQGLVSVILKNHFQFFPQSNIYLSLQFANEKAIVIERLRLIDQK